MFKEGEIGVRKGEEIKTVDVTPLIGNIKGQRRSRADGESMRRRNIGKWRWDCRWEMRTPCQ